MARHVGSCSRLACTARMRPLGGTDLLGEQVVVVTASVSVDGGAGEFDNFRAHLADMTRGAGDVGLASWAAGRREGSGMHALRKGRSGRASL